jgi:hypothetical protein
MPNTEQVVGTATSDNEIAEVTIGDVAWRIRVTLDGETVTLCDAATGELLHQQALENLGIRYENGRYQPGTREREALLMSLVIAWILMRQTH